MYSLDIRYFQLSVDKILFHPPSSKFQSSLTIFSELLIENSSVSRNVIVKNLHLLPIKKSNSCANLSPILTDLSLAQVCLA